MKAYGSRLLFRPLFIPACTAAIACDAVGRGDTPIADTIAVFTESDVISCRSAIETLNNSSVSSLVKAAWAVIPSGKSPTTTTPCTINTTLVIFHPLSSTAYTAGFQRGAA